MLKVKNLRLLNGKSVNLELKPGERLHLKGANGSGKSLLLKALARLIPLEIEDLTFEGKSFREVPLPVWRHQLLYLPPQVNFIPEMTGEDFLGWPFQLKLHREKNFSTTEILQKYPWAKQKMQLLSSGQLQLLAFERAFLLNPKVLMMDECLAHVDQENRGLIWQKIDSYQSLSIINVGHEEIGPCQKKIQTILI
jgi:ABC-type iron transport system FetAB ATPase subunit